MSVLATKVKVPIMVAILALGFVTFGLIPKEGCACLSTIQLARRTVNKLVDAQESSRELFGTYASSNTMLDTLGFQTAALEYLVITSGTPTGWSAIAHQDGEAWTCGIFVGDAVPPVGGVEERQLKCVGTTSFARWWFALRH